MLRGLEYAQYTAGSACSISFTKVGLRPSLQLQIGFTVSNQSEYSSRSVELSNQLDLVPDVM